MSALPSSLSTSAALAGRTSRRKQARPGELLAAALTLFTEKGYAATRAEEVARLAGVSKGTLFLYYPSKEELFKAVVRENLAGRFPQWNAEFEAYAGSTPEMLRYTLLQWWERVGNTPASGLTKLVMSESSNFPELADFYQQEVILPGQELIRRILQRGVDRGEFVIDNIDHSIFVVLAPMIFLTTWKHSFGTRAANCVTLDPQTYLQAQVQIILHGLCQPNQTLNTSETSAGSDQKDLNP